MGDEDDSSVSGDDEVAETELLDSNEFINRYLYVADQYSHDNPRMHLGFALALVGEAISDCSIGAKGETCRVHPFILQSSGTGKQDAFGIAKQIADEVDSGLPEGQSYTFGNTKDLTRGNLTGTIRDGEKKPGVAEQYDFVGLTEAEALFKDSTIRERLRHVLDEDTYEREMGGGTVRLESYCTVVGTTYPELVSAKDISKFIDEGSFARFLYFFKDVSPEDSLDIVGEVLTDYSSDAERERSISKEEEQQYRNEIVSTLQTLIEYYSEGVQFEVDISEETLKTEIEDWMNEKLGNYNRTVRELSQPLLTRYSIHALRIAAIVAALDGCSHKITADHLEEAHPYLEQSFDSVLEYLELHGDDVESAGTAGLRRALKKQENMMKMLELVIEKPNITKQELAAELPVGPETVRNYANELSDRGMVEIGKSGRKAVYITPRNDLERPGNGLAVIKSTDSEDSN